MKEQLIKFYLDYVNNFLTVSNMAEYYGMSENDCSQLIEIGRKMNENN